MSVESVLILDFIEMHQGCRV